MQTLRIPRGLVAAAYVFGGAVSAAALEADAVLRQALYPLPFETLREAHSGFLPPPEKWVRCSAENYWDPSMSSWARATRGPLRCKASAWPTTGPYPDTGEFNRISSFESVAKASCMNDPFRVRIDAPGRAGQIGFARFSSLGKSHFNHGFGGDLLSEFYPWGYVQPEGVFSIERHYRTSLGAQQHYATIASSNGGSQIRTQCQWNWTNFGAPIPAEPAADWNGGAAILEDIPGPYQDRPLGIPFVFGEDCFVQAAISYVARGATVRFGNRSLDAGLKSWAGMDGEGVFVWRGVTKVWAADGTEITDYTVSTFDQAEAQSFSEWIAAKFGAGASDAAIVGPTADPDGDGLANLIEYAFGSDPNSVSTEGKPEASYEYDASTGRSYLALKFRRAMSAFEANVELETSADLVTWENRTIVEPIGDELAGQVQVFRGRDDASVAGSPQRYGRVRVTLSP